MRSEIHTMYYSNTNSIWIVEHALNAELAVLWTANYCNFVGCLRVFILIGLIILPVGVLCTDNDDNTRSVRVCMKTKKETKRSSDKTAFQWTAWLDNTVNGRNFACRVYTIIIYRTLRAIRTWCCVRCRTTCAKKKNGTFIRGCSSTTRRYRLRGDCVGPTMSDET